MYDLYITIKITTETFTRFRVPHSEKLCPPLYFCNICDNYMVKLHKRSVENLFIAT